MSFADSRSRLTSLSSGSYPELQPNLNRDQNPDHSKIKQEVTEEAEQKYDDNAMIFASFPTLF